MERDYRGLNRVIEFFYKNRVIDAHIGIWKLHIWLYFFCTYFNMYIIDITIKNLIEIGLRINRDCVPRLFSFTFKIFNVGINTDKKYYAELCKRSKNYTEQKKETKKKFMNNLNEDEIDLIKEYDEIN